MSAPTDYIIQQSDDGIDWTTITDGVSTDTDYTVTGLTDGTSYYFRVAGTNAVGDGSFTTAVSATPAAVIPPTAPGTPVGFYGTVGIGSGQARLTWRAPANGGSAITDYIIERSIDGVLWTTVTDGVSTDVMYTATGLTNGTSYKFRVSARNAVGDSAPTALLTVTPTATTMTTVHPAVTSGRKILDQHGDPYLLASMSSYGMAQQLSNANITTALEAVAANGFTGVTVWLGGGYHHDETWHQYTNVSGSPFWTGTPWASSLGAGWSTYDWIISEAERLGLVVSLSLCSFGETGAGPDWETASDANMQAAGTAIATRYLTAPNIVWSVMFADSTSPTSTRGSRVQAFFTGVNAAEGASSRPVRWSAPVTGFSTYALGWVNTGAFKCSMNSLVSDSPYATFSFEGRWGEVVAPVGDGDAPYVGNPTYVLQVEGTSAHQQVRERNYSTLIEGGSYINFGHEDWWNFDANTTYDTVLSWTGVQAEVALLQASYCWVLADTYIKDATWAPSTNFLIEGEGFNDTKAAQGRSNNCAIVYFPDTRTPITVNTSLLAGTGAVRLRWFNPVTNTYTTISASEAQTSSRSVTYPTVPARTGSSLGTTDMVLVVDNLIGA